MIMNPQMQQFVHDDVFLKLPTLSQDLLAEGYGPIWRTRSPFVLHLLHPNLRRFDIERVRPTANDFLEGILVGESRFLGGHGME